MEEDSRTAAGREAPQGEPLTRVPAPVLVVIGLLVAVHGGLLLTGEDWRVWSLYALSLIPARFGPEPFPYIPGSQFWSFLTHGLLHADALHLFFNCLWLLIFSSVVQRRMGTVRYLLVLVAGLIGGSLGTLLLHWGEAVIMIGASTAVSAAVAAAIPVMYAPGFRFGDVANTDLAALRALSPGELISDRRAFMFLVIWLVVTLLSGSQMFTGSALVGNSAIAWEAHLGGFAAGLAAFYALDRRSTLPRPQT
jgi:membrane associated rhomboid family serine protease